MAKKRKAPPVYTGGAASHKKRGLRPILIPVRPDVHTALTRAASMADPPVPVTVYAAAGLESLARQALAVAGLEWPAEEKSE